MCVGIGTVSPPAVIGADLQRGGAAIGQRVGRAVPRLCVSVITKLPRVIQRRDQTLARGVDVLDQLANRSLVAGVRRHSCSLASRAP